MGQLLIKKAAKNSSGYVSRDNVIGAALLVTCIPLSLFVLSKVDFSVFYSFSALIYVFIIIFSKYFLNEIIDWKKTAGIIFIILGILVFNFK